MASRKLTANAQREADKLEEAVEGNRRQIVVDWDGTCVELGWPEQVKTWMPGAVRALRDMNEYAQVVIFSARTSPFDPHTKEEREPEITQAEIKYIRDMLDAAGLTDVAIWTLPGKPSGDVYIDDKAERYNGHVHSWDKMRRKMRMRFQAPDGHFPPWGREDIEEDE